MTVSSPSGAELLASEQAELAKRLRDVLVAKAQRAREDVVAFFEFVMVEEHTGRPIKVVPHQKLMFDFITHYDRGVIMMPIGHAKTFTIAGYLLWRLGNDVMTRAAIVSATESQATKVLRMVRDYIESSAKLRLVFPHLRKSQREVDPWTQTEITIDRPRGIRDPSVVAWGLDSKRISGSRVNLIFVDDVITAESVTTSEQREKDFNLLMHEVKSRLDPSGNVKIILTNTARHPDDIPHRLIRHYNDSPPGPGWPMLLMQVTGDVTIRDDGDNAHFLQEYGIDRTFDSDVLRPKYPGADDPWCRLVGRSDEDTLWPERVPMSSDDPNQTTVERERLHHLPVHFNQLYMQICRDDESSMCKQEYINLCLQAARDHNVYGFQFEFASELIFTGVDLAVGKGEENDFTCIFTFAVLPSGHRLILEIKLGRWSIQDIQKEIIDTVTRFKSVVRVENIAAQDWCIQLLREKNLAFPVRPHLTTREGKANPQYGIPALFLEMSSGAWLIPNRAGAQLHPNIQRFVNACLNYTPAGGKHVDDTLMALHFAHSQAREWGVLVGGAVAEMMARNQGSIGMSIMSR